MKVKDLERNVRDTLNDQGAEAYSQDLIIRGINQGARAIVSLRPDAATKYKAVPLVANQSDQVLPDTENPHRLLDITHDMGADGSTPGAPINRVKREELDGPCQPGTPTPAPLTNGCLTTGTRGDSSYTRTQHQCDMSWRCSRTTRRTSRRLRT